MRKFLSLVLALAMTMSLVIVSSSAKEFTDDDELNYEEAVAVISEIGVVDGYADGSFNPQGGLTRGAAAKIICNLILGPTTAAELHADTRPFPDVAIDSEFAGYIAYCAQQGIISGYADGEFKAANPLTGYAFMKMLLGALGYDSDIEQYVGENWSIQVAKQAIGIGLNSGLKEEFNGVDYVTREEAALYAFNTLKATLVDYENKISANVNGAEVVISNNTAKPVDWSEGRNKDGNIKPDGFVQFAEEFFPDLVRKDDHTKLMEPANNWVYKKTEIGTYERYDLIVETYTTGVTGRDLYDLLKPGVIRDNNLEIYVDGIDAKGTGTIAAANGHGEIVKFDKANMVRSNNDDLGETGTGVLTKVYLDTDNELITIVSINTYLAQATADYNETKEYAPLNVYVTNATGMNYNVDVEDVADVADVTEDTYYRVNMSWKDDTNRGEVVTINDVEILEDSTVTKFSAGNSGDGTDKVTKVTVGGEEYEANEKAFYDDDILNEYDENLLTDKTYNVYLDQYGNFLGIDLFEGTNNYVFITGYDLDGSHIAVRTATAAAIFLDGTMDEIKVNVTDTNDNITDVLDDDEKDDGKEYFDLWTAAGSGGDNAENNWYTYTVDENSTYTLKPAIRSTKSMEEDESLIRTDSLYVDGDVTDEDGVLINGARVYGEDETVYLTVDTGAVSRPETDDIGITEVTGLYTGVQSVEIEIDASDAHEMGGDVFTVYDSDHYIIAAVVLGDAIGSNENLAYILSGVKSEEYRDGVYYWEFDAVMDGTIQNLTARSNYPNVRNVLNNHKYDVMELRFDGDYVTDLKEVSEDKIYDYDEATVGYPNNTKIDDESIYFVEGLKKDANVVSLSGNTLYITKEQNDTGLAIARDAKAVVIQKENGSVKETEFATVESAINYLADADESASAPGKQYAGDIFALLNSNTSAAWVVFNSETELKSGTGSDFTDDGTSTTLPSTTDMKVTVDGGDTGVGGQGRYDATHDKLYLKFDGLTAQASKVELPVYVEDEFGVGKNVVIPLEIAANDDLDNDESNVYVLDFSTTEFPDNYIVRNEITVTVEAADTVKEWYVKYDGTAEYASKTTTVANEANAEFTFTVKKAGAEYDITDSSTNITEVSPDDLDQTDLTADQSYTVKLTAKDVAPVVDLDYANATVNISVQASASAGNGITAVYTTTPTATAVKGAAADGLNVTVVTGTAAVATNNQFVVNYTVNGVSYSQTLPATASTTNALTLGTGAGTGLDAANADLTVVITSVKVQAKITVTESIETTDASNLTANATATYNGKSAADIQNEWLDVGSTVSVVVKVPGVTGNGVNVTIGSTPAQAVTTGTNVEVSGTYTVVVGSNGLTVKAENIV